MSTTMSKIETEESAGIILSEALALAESHERTQRMQIAAELADLRNGGLPVNVTASELLQLESAGMIYDFSTGLVQVGASI